MFNPKFVKFHLWMSLEISFNSTLFYSARTSYPLGNIHSKWCCSSCCWNAVRTMQGSSWLPLKVNPLVNAFSTPTVSRWFYLTLNCESSKTMEPISSLKNEVRTWCFGFFELEIGNGLNTQVSIRWKVIDRPQKFLSFRSSVDKSAHRTSIANCIANARKNGVVFIGFIFSCSFTLSSEFIP